jgi:hypothetical protein
MSLKDFQTNLCAVNADACMLDILARGGSALMPRRQSSKTRKPTKQSKKRPSRQEFCDDVEVIA